MKKKEINEIPILAELEKIYDDCSDVHFGTFDYELFGEKVFRYLKSLGLKKFSDNHDKND